MEDKVLGQEGTELFKKEKEFWLNQFNDNFQISTISYDSKIINGKPMIYERENFTITGEQYEKLMWIVNSSDYRLLMVLIANYFLLLKKYTNSEDLTVGTTIYKQETNAEFINTILPLKTKVIDEMSFKDMIMEMRNCINNAIEHQNYPMTTLIDELKLNDESEFNPLFDSLILLENIQDPKYVKGIKPSLIIKFIRKDNSIDACIEYNSNLYTPGTIKKIINYYHILLKDVLSNLDKKVNDIQLLSNEEKAIILNKFNSNDRVVFEFKTVFQWFEHTVKKWPGNIAIQFYDSQASSYHEITYKELYDKVIILSNKLYRAGVKSNTIVTLLVEQSIDRVIAMLASLKCGAAYLPLEINTPEERLKLFIKDSNSNVILSKSKNIIGKEYLFEIVPQNNILLLDDEDLYKNEKVIITNITSSEEDLAYVIYTSGSTGRPKGVLIDNRGILNYTNWRSSTYKMTEKDVTLQLLSYAFDGFASNFYTSIVSGGRLVIMEDTENIDSERIISIIKETGVTNLSLIPKLLELIVNSSNKNDLQSLRFIVLAGEKTEQSFLQMLESEFADLQIINEYGPTEASVTSLAKLNFSSRDIDSIGKPIDNTRVLVLNNSKNLNPVRLAGEICISGDGIARGYLNDPEKTANSFISNPVFKDSMMYKTGDIGYWNETGEIIYAGRRDYQIKVRGFRIELREIEACLKDHAKIREVVVVSHKLNKSDYQLLAYYSTIDNTEIEYLPIFAGKYLPKYMIPDFFIHIEKFRKTISGKIDLKNLPLPADKSTEFKRPGNETEEVLVQIWSEVLNQNKDQISINSNFFEIGGHSLNATFIASKIQKYLNVKISMIDIFEHPYIEVLAKIISGKSQENYSSFTKADEKEYYELTPAQKRFFFLQQYEINTTAYNIPVTLEIKGNLNVNKLKKAFELLVKRHQSLRTVFTIKDNIPVQKIVDSSEVLVEIFRIEASELDSMREKFVRPFNLSNNTLYRIGLVEINGQFKYLLFDMHHIIIDALSMQILVKEFIELYEEQSVSELKITYLDCIQNRLDEVKSAGYKKQETFWVDYLKDGIPRLNLPIDYKRSESANTAGKTVKFKINEEYTAKLKQISKNEEVSLYILMLSIYKIFIHKLTCQNDIIIGTPVSGRSHADVETIVGLFINTIVIRNKIDEDQSFNNFLKVLKSNTLRAFDNQSYDFSELVDKFPIDRIEGRNPIFDLFFVFDNFKFQKTVNQDLELRPLDYFSTTTKFDLTLMVLSEQDEIEFIFEYNDKLFKKETIISMSEKFNSILTDIVDDRNKKIQEYGLKTTEVIVPDQPTNFEFTL